MNALLRGRTALLIACMVSPATAHAHLVSTRFGDFYAGLMHPLTAFENLLPWLALGLLAGLHGGKSVRWMLLVFPLAVCAGGFLSQVVPVVASMAPFNLFSFVALGGLVALARPLPRALLLGLGTLFGLSHGYDNGLALAKGGSLFLFSAGIATAGYVVIALSMAATLAAVRQRVWAQVAVRAAGSWIAAVGIMMLGVSLATK